MCAPLWGEHLNSMGSWKMFTYTETWLSALEQWGVFWDAKVIGRSPCFAFFAIVEFWFWQILHFVVFPSDCSEIFSFEKFHILKLIFQFFWSILGFVCNKLQFFLESACSQICRNHLLLFFVTPRPPLHVYKFAFFVFSLFSEPVCISRADQNLWEVGVGWEWHQKRGRILAN